MSGEVRRNLRIGCIAIGGRLADQSGVASVLLPVKLFTTVILLVFTDGIFLNRPRKDPTDGSIDCRLVLVVSTRSLFPARMLRMRVNGSPGNGWPTTHFRACCWKTWEVIGRAWWRQDLPRKPSRGAQLRRGRPRPRRRLLPRRRNLSRGAVRSPPPTESRPSERSTGTCTNRGSRDSTQ